MNPPFSKFEQTHRKSDHPSEHREDKRITDRIAAQWSLAAIKFSVYRPVRGHAAVVVVPIRRIGRL